MCYWSLIEERCAGKGGTFAKGNGKLGLCSDSYDPESASESSDVDAAIDFSHLFCF